VSHPHELTLNLPEPELVMWDGAGTAIILARGFGSGAHMTPRTRAITKALLLLALEEIEAEVTP
jgi:hypothetical protein